MNFEKLESMAMMRAAGAWRSPNHHHVVLMNWAKKRNIDIGQKGCAGYALFVDMDGKLPAFIVEGRGPKAHNLRCVFTWLDGGRSQFDRSAAFKKALDLYARLIDRRKSSEALKLS